MLEAHNGPRGVLRELVRARLFPHTPVKRILDRYQPRRVIGRGGAGVVLSAFDPTLERKVAIKVMQRVASSGGERRLLEEARLMARVHHPNVISVFDVGIDTERDVVFVVMEHVDGESLAEWLQAPRSFQEKLSMLLGVGQGLYAAHCKGVVHRDFKPHNVIVGNDGYPRVLDFGLASALAMSAEAGQDGARRLTSDMPAGTPGYLSPEHWRGHTLDERSDQFAFCLTVTQALIHVKPPVVWSSSELRTALRQIHQQIRDARLGPDLEEVLLQGLAWAKEDRFSSMRRLLRLLERLDPRSAMPAPPPEPEAQVHSERAWVSNDSGNKTFVWAPVGLPPLNQVVEDVRAFTEVARTWGTGKLEFRCWGLPRFPSEVRRIWEHGLTDLSSSVLLKTVGARSSVRMGLNLLGLSTGVVVVHEDLAETSSGERA